MPNTGAVYKPRAARKIASSRSGVSSSRCRPSPPPSPGSHHEHGAWNTSCTTERKNLNRVSLSPSHLHSNNKWCRVSTPTPHKRQRSRGAEEPPPARLTSPSGPNVFFFFFLTKEYIHAIPHRQPWLHGAYLQSFDTTTTLMKLFLLAYRPQVMTQLYSYQYFLILITITTTSVLLPYPSHPHPITPHGGEVVLRPQATLENV